MNPASFGKMRAASVVFVALLTGLTLRAEHIAGQIADVTLPLYYPAQSVPGNSLNCPPEGQLKTAIGRIDAEVRGKVREALFPEMNDTVDSPCGPGWRRVAYLNMTNPSQSCPSEWRQYSDHLHDDIKRGCGRPLTQGASCNPISYQTGEAYSSVCGRVIGYQYSHTDAFYPYNSALSVDLDGIIVSHGGNNSDHIWSFVAGLQQFSSFGVDDLSLLCPCALHDMESSTPRIPPYIGNNYFCESSPVIYVGRTLYLDNPLWDGDGCTISNSGCCSFNSPPWFNVQLDEPTEDDINVKICASDSTENEDVIIEQMEIYVK